MSTATMVDPFAGSATNKSGGGGDRETPPGGTYPAALVGLIDMGTTPEEFEGKTRDQRKVLLVWELCGEHDSKGVSFKVARDFPFGEVVSNKNPLRKLLETWRGAAYGEDEKVLILPFMGKTCMLSLTEGSSAKGNKFVKVANVTSPPKGMEKSMPPPSVELFVWSFDGKDPQKDPEFPDWVPEYIYGRPLVDDIKASKEWKSLLPF